MEATDGGTPSLSDVATVNINVSDINDNTPVFSQDTYTTVVGEDAALEQSVITVRTFPHSLPLLKGATSKIILVLLLVLFKICRSLLLFSQRTGFSARAPT